MFRLTFPKTRTLAAATPSITPHLDLQSQHNVHEPPRGRRSRSPPHAPGGPSRLRTAHLPTEHDGERRTPFLAIAVRRCNGLSAKSRLMGAVRRVTSRSSQIRRRIQRCTPTPASGKELRSFPASQTQFSLSPQSPAPALACTTPGPPDNRIRLLSGEPARLGATLKI